MSDPNEPAISPSAAGEPARPTRLVCPECKAVYRLAASTSGRRVRCRHCGHVWRDETGAVDAVAGALSSTAANWARLGAAARAQGDHASAMAGMAAELIEAGEPLAAEWVGRRLGRYQLRAVLGQGAMGHVYEAIDKDLHRTVAIKLLPRKIDPECVPVGLKMFLQEARIAARLQHPNIVTVYEVGEEDGTYFFAMERVRGATLTKLIEQHGPLPANQACYLIAHVAAALAAGHAQGIVHRDVKPGNIMMDTNGQVKVTDFGLAQVKAMQDMPELAGRPLGTPGWISPEVARGEEATPASDIYGLGLTLYYILTGKRLIQGGTRSGMVRMQRTAKSMRREELPESWPPRLRDIVVQCLQADPKDRYQSADALAGELMRALVPTESDATVVLGSSTEARADLVPPVVSWIVLVVLLGVVAALAILWHWLQP